jgi:hypothetical protein
MAWYQSAFAPETIVRLTAITTPGVFRIFMNRPFRKQHTPE